MRDVAISLHFGKPRSERAIERELANERVAWTIGANGGRCRWEEASLRRAWERGRAFAALVRAGLRPLDAVRIKGAQEARRA